MLETLDVFDDLEPRSAAMNMAIDEALLQFAARPALRFYRWQRPALSFGYFGAFADVAAEADLRELVRRWTGGGIVLHGLDLTYSVILPKSDRVDASHSRLVYAQIHGAIRAALGSHMNVALASEAAPKVSEACFANPVVADVLVDGRKVAGAAQRRTRAGLLHQGSIQHDHLPAEFAETFAGTLCAGFERASVSDALLSAAQVIAQQRYGTAEWLRRR